MASKTFTSPDGRVAFPAVYKAEVFEEGQEPKYSLVLLIPKANKAAVAKIRKIYDDCVKAFAAEGKWKGKTAGLRCPIRDADEEGIDKVGYPGCLFMKFSSANRPHVVDNEVLPIGADEGRFYAGCWARVRFSVYAYDKAGNKGVAFSLEGVQKIKDDEPFGAKREAPEEMFETVPFDGEDDIDLLG